MKKNFAEDTGFKTKLLDIKFTDEFFKSFRTFISTTIPATVNLKPEVASNSISQTSLFSKHYASIFKGFSAFRPVETFESRSDDFDTSEGRMRSFAKASITEKQLVQTKFPEQSKNA